MEFPIWAAFGLLSASLSAAMMIVPERVKLDGFVIAFWNKVACLTFMLPAIVYFGLPENPVFYGLVAAQALLWVVSDILFFRAIPLVGAGVVSRILPISVIATFFLWFLFDHALLQKYLETPVRSMAVVIALFLSVYFAMRLKNCPVSVQALRIIWFVMVAAVIGPLMFKLVSQHTDLKQGPFAFVFFEAAVMISLWLIYYAVKKPVPAAVLWSKQAAKTGFSIGIFSSLMVASNFTAVAMVDNPGLVPAVKFTDTILIMLYYRMTGHKEQADVIAGVGIVLCAAVIVISKSV